MGRKKHKKHPKQRSQTKGKEASIENDLPYKNKLRTAASRALSSGWVQNSTTAFVGTAVLLGVAMWTKTGTKAAAIGVGFMGTVALWILVLMIIRYAGETGLPNIVHFGGLTPGSETAQPLPRSAPPNTVQLWLGDNLRILSASSSPVFSKDGKPFLSIGVRKGLMWVTATINDEKNQYICRIIDNEFQISEERSFNPKQPDPHSLLVRDVNGNEVLNIRFLNPTSIWITGRFQIPGVPEPVLILRKEGVRWSSEGGGINNLTLDMTQNTQAGAIGF